MNFFSPPGDVTVVDRPRPQRGRARGAARDHGRRTRPGARLLLGLGTVGDRTDELIDTLGEIGAKGSDVVAIVHKERYLRGRTMDEIDAPAAGRRRPGSASPTSTTYATEVECLAALVAQAPARRRRRADVPRGAAGGLRLARRARRTVDTPRRCAPRCGRRPSARADAWCAPVRRRRGPSRDVDLALEPMSRSPSRSIATRPARASVLSGASPGVAHDRRSRRRR